MPKQAQKLPEHSHAVSTKRADEAELVSDRTQPFDPRVILQRFALAPQSLRPADILRLQQTHGNRFVQRLMSQSSPAPALVQAKLTVNAPGHRYEQEADRVAEAVTRMPAVQGQEAVVSEKPEVMTKPQPSPAAGGVFEAGEAFEQQLRAARGQGQPLPPALREDFETKFGADFSKVRIHTGARAGALNRSIQAAAFTAGRDVFFRPGAYDPGSRDGRTLLAHELTDVLQQRAVEGTAVASVQRMPDNSDNEEEVEGVQAGKLGHNPACGPIAGGNNDKPVGPTRPKPLPQPQKLEPEPLPKPQPQPKPKPPPKPRTKPEPQPVPAELTITSKTQFAAPDGTPDTRTEVGVGEEVMFTGNAPGKWTASNGEPEILASGTTFTWTAPNRKDEDVTIELKVGDKSKTKQMKVLQPASISANKHEKIHIGKGNAGAGMLLILNYHPMKVSFGNTEAKEVPGPATDVKGWFDKRTFPALLEHKPNDKFCPIRENNELDGKDRAKGDAWKPYSRGSFKWVIPNKFRVKTENGDGEVFTHVTQEFSMDKKGTFTITKAGFSFTRRVDES